MKKYLAFIFSFFFLAKGYSQVQATIKPGSAPNSVYITIKSSVTLTAAKFSTFQFAVGIPSSSSAGAWAYVNSLEPLISYPPSLVATEMQAGNSYMVTSFSGDGSQSGPGILYTAGVEYNLAEVFFSGPAPITVTDVRLMQLPNGGFDGTANFYVANAGIDVTTVAAQFYSAIPADAVNDGNGYTGSSWARLASIILPVKFVGFNAIKKDNNAFLTWNVENESALTDRYEIERSFNGTDFIKIGTQLPKNNGNSRNGYTSTDNNLTSLRTSGVIYYRIKQVDKDGKSVYTDIKSVRTDSKSFDASVYPNPVVNTGSINIDLSEKTTINIIVTDASGKEIRTASIDGITGLNKYDLETSKLAAGTYFIKIYAGSDIKTLTVVKKK